jgi:hypothetical protein
MDPDENLSALLRVEGNVWCLSEFRLVTGDAAALRQKIAQRDANAASRPVRWLRASVEGPG